MAYYNGKKVMAVVDYKPAILIEKEITKGGEYNASDDNADGYSKVIVGAVKPEGNPLQDVIDNKDGDGVPSCENLFYKYKGTSLDSVLSTIDVSLAKNMSNMFYYCYNLTNIPTLDISNATNMYRMFNGCYKVQTITLLNTSNVTTMEETFYDCKKLTSIPELDTSNVTKMYGMFRACESITTIPFLDTSKVTDMEKIFMNCISLISVPKIDISKITSMSSMFMNCTSLTSIPDFDTSNIVSMYRTFYNCESLTSIPNLNASKVNGFDQTFYNCTSLTSIGIYGFTRSIDISRTALEHDALVAFLNQAGTAYNSSQRISMGSAKLALLSDDEKAIATNKGWTLA